jgi:hypothetical protein
VLKLTPEEVAIMIKVRENMQRAYEDRPARSTFYRPPEYICLNILKVVLERDPRNDGLGLPAMMEKVGGVAERLYRHIMWALRGCGTMRGFISTETEKFGYVFSRWASEFEAEARLAWLDRIIEMEDIK